MHLRLSEQEMYVFETSEDNGQTWTVRERREFKNRKQAVAFWKPSLGQYGGWRARVRLLL